MATGDITVTINPDGWTANLSVAGFTSGATYAFGYTGTTPGASTPYIDVVSEGYTGTTLGTTTRRVYFTANVDVPYSTKTMPGTFNSGAFVDGETITCSTSGATAKVVGAQASGAILRFRTLTGTPLSGQTWTGATGSFTNSSSTVTTLSLPKHDELAPTGSLTTKVALSDYVYLDDNTGAGKSSTAPTVTIPAAFITNSGGASQTSNSLSAAAVTQNSTQDYPNAIAHFVTLPYKLLQGAFTVECQAFSRHATGGQPVAAVKFTFADGTVTRTQTITAMTLSAESDTLPVFAASDTASNFTQGANVTCKIECFPQVGDLDNVRDSSANAWMNAGLALANLPVGVCDKNGTYVGANGATFCAVNSATGNDTTGVASATQATAEASPVQTISKAWKKIQDFNNSTYSRNTVDGGRVLLIGGGHLYGDGAETINAHTGVACTITRASGTTRANAQITGFNVTSRYGPRISRLYDMSIVASSSANQQFGWGHNATSPMLFEDCTITGAGGSTQLTAQDTSGKAGTMFKNCTITGITGRIGAGNDNQCLLFRGGSIDGVTGDVFNNARCVTGTTLIDSGSAAYFFKQNVTAGWTDGGNTIISFNTALSMTGGPFFENLPESATEIKDVAIVENLIERIGASGSPLIEISAAPITNVLVWHNTLAGDRLNTEGEVTGGAGTGTDHTFQLCSYRFNSVYYNGTHNPGDVHVSNGAIVGQWPYSQFCVGWAGNNSEITPDAQLYSFGGIGTTVATAAGYVSDRSKQGTTAGGGDYHPAAGSILRSKVPSGAAVIPYDKSGAAIFNDGTGSAGAYQQTRATTNFFFAQ